ncbi:MAG: tRNA(His) guanylyltransferase Thg1 family protein [Deltaproteobacteria bacterium]|nr:tRNA(His) guanylyltransferase Thg1 family protein [Deltaproteobacteria bacterium]
MTTLSERMKAYEGAEASRTLATGLPVLARIDGRAFHTFAGDLPKPYDNRLSQLMIDVMCALIQETGARVGYTQSDEITLLWLERTDSEQLWFGRRVQKMTSQLAAQTSAMFNHLLPAYLPEKAAKRTLASLPTFDARVWSVPSREEACNVFLWREQDAVRNSIEALARAHFSHGELQQKDTQTMTQMLAQRDIRWGDLPARHQRGTYAQRRTVLRIFAADELDALPERHLARTDPTRAYERTAIEVLDLPALSRVVNRDEVLLDGAAPTVRESV